MIPRAREILSSRRISLRTIIVLLVLSIVLPILIVVAAWRQQQSAALVAQLMNLESKRISADEVAAVSGLFDPIAQAVTLDADLGDTDAQALPRALFDELMDLPDAYSFYFGFAGGGFLQVVRLPEGVARFGPYGARPPPGARYVLRRAHAATAPCSQGRVHLSRRVGQRGRPRACKTRCLRSATPSLVRGCLGLAGTGQLRGLHL